MLTHVFSDKHIDSDKRTQDWVTATVEVTLERHLEDLTRVEVHLSDENGGKSGPKDKRCKMEARPKGHQPILVSHDADSLTQAVEGAAEKLEHALEHLFGKLRGKRTAALAPEGFEANEPKQSVDALLEEEFLEKEKELELNS
ncbi:MULTISPECIES: HPF/RaiA family ribosome-associated protein [Pseudomonas]|jgi:ribosome-associated translation inhibitor RaiA|uniref:HPF/RaiA family ribosome-associated protein n=1 Tax=Pseudomonas psychrophila TaxID=122355 RepID=A0A8I1FQN7_9PSED|nr:MULTISPECIES: HPF/RaiA family ribosome-associated protein [Pseudomonas]EPJ94240.1 putative ribosomal subunit interface protein [Pseudomonas psychrophila]KAB0490385.1 HPF/RaiA family ribosome-associated protein [Pseudomonas psychrophila]KMN01347.1 ribosomal subunit interface protein [Pseudomonas psychrophila]KOX64129.1 ribosomal subunit interface protein [Pseudomonas psychrophila]MBJ2256943.1 HPF/RaiA family ribosome-associated protein [Pseudomonas psychrophila]